MLSSFFLFLFFFFNIWLFYTDVWVSTLVVNSVTWTFPPVQCVFSFAQCCFAVCLHSQTVLMGWTPLEAETLPSSERRWERWSGEAGCDGGGRGVWARAAQRVYYGDGHQTPKGRLLSCRLTDKRGAGCILSCVNGKAVLVRSSLHKHRPHGSLPSHTFQHAHQQLWDSPEKSV